MELEINSDFSFCSHKYCRCTGTQCIVLLWTTMEVAQMLTLIIPFLKVSYSVENEKFLLHKKNFRTDILNKKISNYGILSNTHIDLACCFSCVGHIQ